MIEALRRARAAGLRTGLISNSWGRGRYDRSMFGELFDGVVISGEVGLHKPQPEIFELGAERVGSLPAECVFVDDLRENCAGAEAVGMTAVLHRDADETLERLEELLGSAALAPRLLRAATISVYASASRRVTRPGSPVADRLSVEPHERLDLARRGGQEQLVRRLQRLSGRMRRLDGSDAQLGAEAQHLLARDARQAARRQRRRLDAPVAHGEHVRGRRLAELAASGSVSSASSAPLPRASRQRQHVLGAATIVFTPASGLCSSRRQRETIAEAVGGQGASGAAVTSSGRRPSPRARPAGPGPLVSVIRMRASARPLPRRPRRTALLERRRAPAARCPAPARRHQPLEVLGQRERHARVAAQRLEHAVADQEAVVGRRDAGLVLVDRAAVEPDASRQRPRAGGPAAPPRQARLPPPRSRRAALCIVSRHSAPGRSRPRPRRRRAGAAARGRHEGPDRDRQLEVPAWAEPARSRRSTARGGPARAPR